MEHKYADLATLPYTDPEKEHRVAIVLNGDKKCGYHISLNLYNHGYTVYIGCRNVANYTKAYEQIKLQVNKTNIGTKTKRKNNAKQETAEKKNFGRLEYLPMDMKDLKTVMRAVLRFQKAEERLDLLIDSGGGYIGVAHQTTKDGFDLQLQTNYVSQALCALLLLPQINHAKGKIIFMSSVCHFLQYQTCDAFEKQTYDYSPSFIFSWFRYGLAKTLCIQFLKILAIKNPSITCYSVNPGIVINTNIFSSLTTLPVLGIFFWLFFQMVTLLFGVSEQKGAASVVQLALGGERSLPNTKEHNTKRSVDLVSGKYFNKYGIAINPSPVANNLDNSASTWILTVRLLRDRNIQIPSDL